MDFSCLWMSSYKKQGILDELIYCIGWQLAGWIDWRIEPLMDGWIVGFLLGSKNWLVDQGMDWSDDVWIDR